MSSRPEAERALLRAGAAPSEEETQRFYAQRVSDYARVLLLIFGGLYVLGLLLTLAMMPERGARDPHLAPGGRGPFGGAFARAHSP